MSRLGPLQGRDPPRVDVGWWLVLVQHVTTEIVIFEWGYCAWYLSLRRRLLPPYVTICVPDTVMAVHPSHGKLHLV